MTFQRPRATLQTPKTCLYGGTQPGPLALTQPLRTNFGNKLCSQAEVSEGERCHASSRVASAVVNSMISKGRKEIGLFTFQTALRETFGRAIWAKTYSKAFSL